MAVVTETAARAAAAGSAGGEMATAAEGVATGMVWPEAAAMATAAAAVVVRLAVTKAGGELEAAERAPGEREAGWG